MRGTGCDSGRLNGGTGMAYVAELVRDAQNLAAQMFSYSCKYNRVAK